MKYQELINNLDSNTTLNENTSITWSKMKKLLQTNTAPLTDTDQLNSASERQYQNMFTKPEQTEPEDDTQDLVNNNLKPDEDNEDNEETEDEIDPKTGLKKKGNPVIDPNNPNGIKTESVDMNVYLQYLETHPFSKSNPFNTLDK